MKEDDDETNNNFKFNLDERKEENKRGKNTRRHTKKNTEKWRKISVRMKWY